VVVSLCCDCQDTDGNSLHCRGVLPEVSDSLVDGGGLGSYLGIGGLVSGLISDLVGRVVVWPELGLGTDRPGARSEFVLISAGLGFVLLVARLERALLVARPK
jgi:hypothetical protein